MKGTDLSRERNTRMSENEKKKKQLFDFLLRKGYSYDIIKEAFRQMEERR